MEVIMAITLFQWVISTANRSLAFGHLEYRNPYQNRIYWVITLIPIIGCVVMVCVSMVKLWKGYY